MNLISRRRFLKTATASAAALACTQGSAESSDAPISFFLVGDTHYLAQKQDPGKLFDDSATTNRQLIDTLNQLAGTPIPEAAGGGVVAAPRGVIHAGDLIDSGDKGGPTFTQMQATEWEGFVADYGLNGDDGRLRYPVFEVYGNHDSPHGEGLVLEELKRRNQNRKQVTAVSKNSLHYSWDWGPLHFVNLGLVVGESTKVVRKRRYAPLQSLEFLIDDLRTNVGDSGRPIVLTHHVDIARYATAVDPEGPATNAEWDPADVQGYYEAIKSYNVIAILFGHTHVRDLYSWNGTTEKGKVGISVYNVDNSSHFAGLQQAFFYIELRGTEWSVREIATKDRWQSYAWTPQVWKKQIRLG